MENQMDKANGMMTAHTAKMIKEKRMEKDKATPRPWVLGGPVESKGYGRYQVTLYADKRPSNSEFSKRPVIAYLQMCDEHWSPIDGIREDQDMQANAELIVKAVNRDHLFDELVEKLEQVKKEWVSDVAFFQTEMSPSDTFIVKEVESLIAKAKASK